MQEFFGCSEANSEIGHQVSSINKLGLGNLITQKTAGSIFGGINQLDVFLI